MVEARDGTSSIRTFLEKALWLPPHAPRQHLLQRGHLGVFLAAPRRLGLRHVPPAEGPAARGAGGDRQGLRDPTPAPIRSQAGFLGPEARRPSAPQQDLDSSTGAGPAHLRTRFHWRIRAKAERSGRTGISLAFFRGVADTALVFGCVWMCRQRSDPPETRLAGFLLIRSRSIEASVMETGRGRGVIPWRERVFGPGYKGSFKWLVAP